MKYIIALDQGTTSSRALLVDRGGTIQGTVQEEYPQIYPRKGWVEHNPMDIFTGQLEAVRKLITENGVDPSEVAALGITNQRETTIVWNKNTGKPVYNAIVWQCRRTADYCHSLKEKGLSDTIREKTGLVIDAYFSASKIRWILENVPGTREQAERGDLLFGTVDTWLIWNLTGGRVHATDYTNASRTMLFNINSLRWDDDLLKIFNIPRKMLPEVKPSSFVYGVTDRKTTGFEIPVASAVGDQQGALFGQMCNQKGSFKMTYGTGGFMLMNIGDTPRYSRKGLLTTIALGYGGTVAYAFEGSVFMAGAVIQWLRDNLGLIEEASETGTIAASVADTQGVYLVPAFQGLGSPYWDQRAKAGIVGLTRGSTKAHIVRAAEESIAYRTVDVVRAMEEDSGMHLREFKVDGGASRDNFLLQFQSDMLSLPVIRPANVETTAMGAAYLAGLAVGFWRNAGDLEEIWEEDRTFLPAMSKETAAHLYEGWLHAVGRCSHWD